MDQVDNQTIALSVFLILFLSFVSRYFKRTLSILVTAVFVLWWEFSKPQQDKLTIDILDVGHGLSLVLERTIRLLFMILAMRGQEAQLLVFVDPYFESAGNS